MPKIIGILGGVSPESTAEYYLHITRTYTQRFGDYGYPEIIIYSVRFQTYVDWGKEERWDDVARGLSDGARILERSGAGCIVIAANTMHIVWKQVQASVEVPVLSLLDVVADSILTQGLQVVGLLGTRFTMEKPFYREALGEAGIEVLVPGPADRDLIHRVIYDELVAGQILEASKDRYVAIIGKLVERGAQGVILGCTEIPLLVHDEHVGVPLFNTTTLHAGAALDYALEEDAS